MDKYEYLLKVDQIEKLMKKKDYQMAVQIADTIDWRRIKNLNVLYAVSEAYEKAERYEDCMEILSIAYDRAPVGRLVLYKMTEIAIRMGNLDEAIALYQDFVKVAPHDQSRFILKYQIYRDRKYSLEDQIKVLKEYKTHEYQEKWAYELASLYAQAGMEKECVQECDELILWFSEGEYVAKALELKQQYEPLTASQQMKYQQAQNPSYQEEISFEEDRFSTADLQAELAANVGELLLENATIEIPELEEEKKSKQRTSKIEIEELVFPGKSPEPEAVPEPVLEIGLEEFTLPEEDTQKPEEESAIELEDFTMPGIIHSQEDEDPEIIMEELTLGNEEEPVEPEEPEVVVEDFSLEEEEVSQSEEPEPELEITMEELTLGDEEEPVEPEEALEVVVEEFSLEEEEVSQSEEPEPELEITMEELTLGDEEEPIEPELEIIMEEITLETEEESVEPEEAPEVVVEEVSQPDEAEPESDITMEEMTLGEEEPKEAETIHGILAKWEDKIAAAEAVLEAKAEQEQERKEKVKQETVELMKLISGISEEIPKDVQEILEEFDKKEKPEKEEKEEPPQSKPEAKKEEEILAIEELKSEPTLLKREKLSGDTASMNMIQELERALATEVSQKAVDAGHLTIEQVRLFDYFTAVRGMSEQLSMLFKGNPRSEMTTSSSGNLVVTGEPGNGKTTLAIDIVKALQKQNQMEGSKLAKITGKRLNTKDIYEVLASLKGGALIIERAGGISEATMMALSLAMETDTGGLLVILEDTSEEIAKLFHKNKNFASKFEYTIDIPVFTNDELVAFGKSYALEQEYTFDEFALLALYGEIGSRQTNDHMVTVAEVKEIIDAAIEHAKKGSIRHLIERVTKKSQDEYGNKLLREADFED